MALLTDCCNKVMFLFLAPISTFGSVKVENLNDAKDLSSLQIPLEPIPIIPSSPIVTSNSNSTSARKPPVRGVKRNRSR